MDSTIPRPGSSSARDALRSFPPLDLAVIDADTGQAREVLSDPDYQAIAALAECVKSNTHAFEQVGLQRPILLSGVSSPAVTSGSPGCHPGCVE